MAIPLLLAVMPGLRIARLPGESGRQAGYLPALGWMAPALGLAVALAEKQHLPIGGQGPDIVIHKHFQAIDRLSDLADQRHQGV